MSSISECTFHIWIEKCLIIHYLNLLGDKLNNNDEKNGTHEEDKKNFGAEGDFITIKKYKDEENQRNEELEILKKKTLQTQNIKFSQFVYFLLYKFRVIKVYL